MKMAKRLMATLLCLAMLLSGFALADEEIVSAQAEEQVLDETNPVSGGGILKLL